MSKNKTRINKARYWWTVLWQEHLQDGWQDTLADTIQLPFAYCVHDKDLDNDNDCRKAHVHIIIAFTNTTTRKHAENVFSLIAGDKAFAAIDAIVDIRHAYNYLIHDTETCRKQDKHLYDVSERVTGNNFDIGMYEQVSHADKMAKLDELLTFVSDNNFLDLASCYDGFKAVYFDDFLAFEVFVTYNAFINRICCGNYCRLTREISSDFVGICSPSQANTHEIPTENTTPFCPECGSKNFVKIGKTAGGTQRFKCKHCGKKFTL